MYVDLGGPSLGQRGLLPLSTALTLEPRLILEHRMATAFTNTYIQMANQVVDGFILGILVALDPEAVVEPRCWSIFCGQLSQPLLPYILLHQGRTDGFSHSIT